MSGIPRYIFIRSNNSANAAPAPPTTPAVVDHHHQAIGRSDYHSTVVSDHDLAAMKRMVQAMSQNPDLLRENCTIPQLTQSMSTDYQEQESSDYPLDVFHRYHHQDANRSSYHETQMAPSSVSPGTSFIGSQQHHHHNPPPIPVTPPRPIKAMTPITPQTQDMTLSYASPRHSYNVTQPASMMMPPYCQECNYSPSLPRPPQPQGLPSQVKLQSPPLITTSSQAITIMGAMTMLDYPSTIAMARSASY